MNNICLLLGAGVSVEQRLPQWKTLVEGVRDYFDCKVTIDEDKLIESIGIIEDERLSALQTLLEKTKFYNKENYQLWSRQQIARATRMCLKNKLINSSYDDVVSKMNLMLKLAESVLERVKKNETTTIITYNYDDYFEFTFRYLLHENDIETMFGDCLASYTIGESEPHLPVGTSEKLVNIYHVHGFIPIFDELFGYKLHNEDKTTYKKNNSDKYIQYLDCGIVLSGNDYNSLIDDSIVGWTNLIQYICYSQLPITIVGFSMTDENFKVLLRRMKKSNNKIKCVKVFFGYDKGCKADEDKAHTNIEVAKFLLHELCLDYQPDVCEFKEELPQKVEEHLRLLL